jgi:hypothetical protein
MSSDRKKHRGVAFIVILLISVIVNYFIVKYISDLFSPKKEGYGKVEKVVSPADREVFKENRTGHLGYKWIIPRSRLDNLRMIGKVNRYGVSGQNEAEQLYGMVLRSLRFQNISRKVEIKYGLPKNIILAMVMKETGGSPLTPNSRDDGGIGLCHMQPSVASDFGLKIYENCRKLRSRSHGRKLRKLINKHDEQLHELIQYDDRFHPVKNLDAVGRMLRYHMLGDQLEDTPVKTAIKRYAGRYNYKQYYQKVVFYQKHLNDKEFIKKLERAFNEANPDFEIDGKKSDFKGYIDYFHKQNINYGLLEYK